MIEWYGELYQDDYVHKNWERVRQSLEDGKFLLGITLIIRSKNENNLFDILDSNELVFPYYRRNKLFVIGVARGQDSALSLVEEIVMDLYRKTDGFKGGSDSWWRFFS